MSQITIRNLPKLMEDEIRRLASRHRISLSKAVIELLHKALGTVPESEKQRDTSCVFGSWDDAQHKEFAENTGQFESIDNEVWE